MDALAKSVHHNNLWQARSADQTFGSAISELTINETRFTGDAGAALQRSYKNLRMKQEICRVNGWHDDYFDIIDWESFGIVFRSMDETDIIQIFKISHRMLPVMWQQLRLN